MVKSAADLEAMAALAAKTVRARGTLPPEAVQAVRLAKADLSITCPTCTTLMQPEHAHYKCPRCGYRDSCCF
jgi:Zn finger protein HypA/HybF involved in hydrogenase expression